MSKFAKRLKQLRQQKGLSQQEMAQLIGINVTNYGNYERDDAMPSAEGLIKLAEVFEVSIDYLLDGKAAEAIVANLEDQDLLQMFKEIEKLSTDKKDHIKYTLESYIKAEKHELVSATSSRVAVKAS